MESKFKIINDYIVYRSTGKLYFSTKIEKNLFDKAKYEKCSKLESEFILKLRAYEEKEDYYDIYSEYSNYGTLFDYLKDRKSRNLQMEENFLRSIIEQIIKGLEILYKEGSIFANLELKDIFINKKDLNNNYYNKNKHYANKIDFSCLTLDNAQIKIKNIYFKKEIDSNFVAKLNNLAPEIIQAIAQGKDVAKNIDYKAEIWALGIITYELLTNNFSVDYNDLINKIKKKEKYLPNNINASKEIIDFIDKLLKLDPKERMDFDEIKNHEFIRGKKTQSEIDEEIKQLIERKNELERIIDEQFIEILES
jgi:serine/threonine protein kinase